MKPRTKIPSPCEVRIDRVGAEGDGVGTLADGTPLYVPFTLPGERIRVMPLRARGDGWFGRAEAIEQPSEARVEPPCPSFGRCGGCALQHWRDGDYADWKRALLTTALRRAGFDNPEVGPLSRGRPGERRRLDFAVRRDRTRITLGLHMAGTGTVIDLAECLVLHPTLMGLLTPVRQVLSGVQAIRHNASLVINLLDNGPDFLLRTDATPGLQDRRALIDFARAHGISRVCWALGDAQPEPVCIFRRPEVTLSGIKVTPPPGAFLQATVEGERAITEAVLSQLPVRVTSNTGRARIAELYAGSGTLTFALAGLARVAAWEGDAVSVAALIEAANRAGLGGRVEAAPRDLARRPLAAKELAGFPVVVLDPPHAGAAAQIVQVAAAGVARVIYVSCNPVSMGRDAKILRAAGYGLAAAAAVDQFVWSARLESVCAFERQH